MVFLAMNVTLDIFFEKAPFVLDSLGSKCLQTQTLSLPTRRRSFVGLTAAAFLEWYRKPQPWCCASKYVGAFTQSNFTK